MTPNQGLLIGQYPRGTPLEAQLEKAGGQKGAVPTKGQSLETWEHFSLDFRLPQSVFFHLQK